MSPRIVLLAALLASGLSPATFPRDELVPFKTGKHQQLVRTFYSTQDGLPGNDINAVALDSNGEVFVAAGKILARLRGQRFVVQPEPAGVSALFAVPKSSELLAGTTNGVWVLRGDQGQLEPGSPPGVVQFSTEPSGTLWALTPDGVWRRNRVWERVHQISERDISGVHCLLPLGPEEAVVASESGLFGLMGKRKYWLPYEVRPGGLLSGTTRGLARLDQDHFLVATDRGLNLTNGKRGWHAFTGQEGLPIENLTGVAAGDHGIVWLASDQGLMRWHEGRWTYLASKRWLPQDRVNCLAPGPDGSVWAGTPDGLAHLYHRTITLEEKAAILQRDLESRDRRHGYVTIMQLSKPGQLDGAQQEISDNDGLWTALYVASQSFRYAVTQSPEAKAQAWRSMQALLRLESITGLSGFPARAICHVDEPQFASRSIRSLPEWHESPVEKGWYWKGETSSDELDGHYFGWQVFFDLAADEEQKQHVRATVKRVTDHILDHGYYLVDKDGKPTTWGVWAPEKLNDDPIWWEERGLNALEILSHLRVAIHIVGDPRYREAYRELIQKHQYAVNTLNAKIGGGVSHDDQLLFLAYYPLLQLEQEPGLRAIFSASLRRTWEMERAEANPLWNFIYGSCLRQPFDVEAAVQSLREIPLDFILWGARNSHRADLIFDPALEAMGIRQLAKPLPWTERTIHKWDKNPYTLDDGSDLGEGDQTTWLLPYWMGRYHRLIE